MINCKNCRYWQPMKDSPDLLGICRRSPPRLTYNNHGAAWPTTTADAMCGMGLQAGGEHEQPEPFEPPEVPVVNH